MGGLYIPIPRTLKKEECNELGALTHQEKSQKGFRCISSRVRG